MKQVHTIHTDEIQFVADMHELTNPNNEAKRIWNNMQKRTKTDRDLKDLYDNCVDPLVEIVKQTNSSEEVYNPVLISLGDMVLNRIDFGKGTEKSINGKLAKKARELNIPSHDYIADHYHEHLGKYEEWAYRNSFWTQMRFNRIKELQKGLQFLHINGNADALSSYVTRYLLNADFKSPNEIYESYSNESTSKYDKRPQASDLFSKENIEVFEFIDSENQELLGYDQHIGQIPIYGEKKGFKLAVCVPHVIDSSDQLKQLDQIKKILPENPTHSMLLIHESPTPNVFGKKENVESLKVYEKALEIMPKQTKIVHGHIHSDELVKYNFKNHETYLIPPNVPTSLTKII